jgi:hypothetical protein
MFQNRNLGIPGDSGIAIGNMKAGFVPREIVGIDRGRDEPVRQLVGKGLHREAGHLVVKAFGPELQVFLHRVLGDVALVDEAYSATCERLWRGLAGFRWQSSVAEAESEPVRTRPRSPLPRRCPQSSRLPFRRRGAHNWTVCVRPCRKKTAIYSCCALSKIFRGTK